ncbi:MAG: cell division protein FtsZ, partial [Thermoplasmata archaeon]
MPNSLVESALSGASPQNPNKAQEPQQEKTAEDVEIEKIASQLDVCIKLVGCGGAGCNTVNRCIEEGLSGLQMLE